MPNEIYDPNSIPQGLESVTIDAVSFIIDDAGSSPNQHTVRKIVRTDAHGDYTGDIMIRKGEGPVERTLTLQRATSGIAAPAAGTTFTWDHDRSGTGSTWVVDNDQTDRGKNDPDTFSVPVTLVSYQS